MQLGMMDVVDEHIGCSGTDVVRGMIDAAQTRLRETTDIFVIKSEYGNILRNAYPILFHDVHHLKGSVIIDRKNAVGTLREIDEISSVFFHLIAAVLRVNNE